jgi:hypothetical protein
VATEFVRGARDRVRAQWWLAHLNGLDTTYDVGRRAGLLLRLVNDAEVSVVDAQVVQHAASLGAAVLTSDPNDLRRLIQASGISVPIYELPWPR